jgi:TolB-like protein
MASILPGFEYDVFISYRHKDNRYDGWVGKFVSNLKKELEATFKEEISVYFDENPTDGLLETHDVDQSLKGKLRALIFIPIVSQTYCDPKSFAWKQELMVFNKLAKEDTIGRDIKLTNGNVSSRILPIKIHELDHEDRSLLEAELGGVLRGVEFIYKSAGVNRPLKPNDDKRENAYHTSYRDQINKAANAIKEIISAIKQPSSEKEARARRPSVGGSSERGNQRRRLLGISGTVALLLLIGFASFYYYNARSEPRDKSIAVIPFVDLSEKRDQEHICDGLMEEILTHLSRIPGLHVISRTSCMQYKGKKISLKEIANELGVTNILEGSIRTSGNQTRVTVQLIDALTDEHLWSEDYDFTDLKDIFSLQTKVSTEVAIVLKGKLTAQEKVKLSKSYTENPEAYKLYIKGKYYWAFRNAPSYDSAEKYFNKAVVADPEYALAYAGLADCYTFGLQGMSHQEELPIAKAYLAKALSLDSTLCEALTVQGFIESHFEYNWEAGKKTLERALRQNPNYSIARLYYGNIFIFTGQDIEKGLDEVRTAVTLDPLSPTVNWALGNRYSNLDLHEKAIDQYQKVIAMDPDNVGAVTWMAYSLIRLKKYDEALVVINKSKGTLPFIREILIALADAERGEIEKARERFKNIIDAPPVRGGSATFVLRLCILINEYDTANTWVETAYEERSLNNMSLKVNPSLEPLRSQPRFKAVLRKMNF